MYMEYDCSSFVRALLGPGAVTSFPVSEFCIPVMGLAFGLSVPYDIIVTTIKSLY